MTPTFGLIIIGDEIMSGKRQDKHMPKVIEFMNTRGLSLGWAEYVGDSPERITATLQRAFASADAVFCCGGIGATPDDHTRQCAAKALGVPLALHPEAKRLIQERMQDTLVADLIFNVAELIEYLSRRMTLLPGDVIATGTPSGVGRPRGIFLKPGDRVRVTISGIGTIDNPVVQGE